MFVFAYLYLFLFALIIFSRVKSDDVYLCKSLKPKLGANQRDKIFAYAATLKQFAEGADERRATD